MAGDRSLQGNPQHYCGIFRAPKLHEWRQTCADSQVPHISTTGLIIISLLLSLEMLLLIPLAVYASWSPRWTAQLDSFAMMRIGATITDKFPLLLSWNKDRINVLDKIPGWIGDQLPEENIGMLGLGAPHGLRRDRKYASYADCREP